MGGAEGALTEASLGVDSLPGEGLSEKASLRDLGMSLFLHYRGFLYLRGVILL